MSENLSSSHLNLSNHLNVLFHALSSVMRPHRQSKPNSNHIFITSSFPFRHTLRPRNYSTVLQASLFLSCHTALSVPFTPSISIRKNLLPGFPLDLPTISLSGKLGTSHWRHLRVSQIRLPTVAYTWQEYLLTVRITSLKSVVCENYRKKKLVYLYPTTLTWFVPADIGRKLQIIRSIICNFFSMSADTTKVKNYFIHLNFLITLSTLQPVQRGQVFSSHCTKHFDCFLDSHKC